jgi:hypothetical protein
MYVMYTTFQAHLTILDLIIIVILQIMKLLIMQLNVISPLLEPDIHLIVHSIICSSRRVTGQVLTPIRDK